MFYSKFMFVKKGPLSKVWIAAHFQRKLNKTHVIGTDISLSAKSILDPSAPLALRLSGQLLLGLVRIYQRKVKYLQEDSTDALTKMKMMFKAGAVDLAEENLQASAAAITHADNIDLVDYEVPEDNVALDDLDLMEQIDPMEGGEEGPPLMSLTQDATLMQDEDDSMLNIRLGDEDLEGLLLNPLDGEGHPMSDIEQLRGGVSDVEVPRDGELGEQEFDLNLNDDFGSGEDLERRKLDQSSRSALGAELSGLDTTTDGGVSDFGGFDGLSTTGDENEDPLVVLDEAAVGQKKKADRPKPKKRKALKFDKNTELSGAQISAQIKDTSDIVLPDKRRETMPLTKRTKLEHRMATLGVPALMELPAREQLTGVSFELEKLQFMGKMDPTSYRIAPELLEVFNITAEVELDDEEIKGKEKDEEGEEVDEEHDGRGGAMDHSLAGDITIDDFDGGDFGGGFDDISSVATKSTAVPLGAGGEEEGGLREIDETVADLEDFFREHNAPGEKDDEEKEEKEDDFGWSARTRKMQAVLNKKFKESRNKAISYDEFVGKSENTSRRTAAGVFYQLLVLQTHKKCKIEQHEPYSDILISKA